MEPKDLEAIVTRAVEAALNRQPDCQCGLTPAAQSELSHMMGMVKDIGDGDHSVGIEIIRENNKALSRFRGKVEEMGSRAAWVIASSVLAGILWLLYEGGKAAIKVNFKP